MKVVLITVDGLHAGWLGAYGNEWVATPKFDQLAAESVVFDQHYCDELGAVIGDGHSTGRYWFPTARGERPGEAERVVHEVLAGQQVSVAMLRESDAPPPHVLDEFSRRATGLLVQPITSPVSLTAAPPAVLEHYADDPEPVDTQLRRVEHGPVDPSDDSGWDQRHRAFAIRVTAWDATLGRLMDELRERGLDRTAVWIVTATGGTALGEHGWSGIGRPWLYEEQVHVPLAIRFPSREQDGRRVSALTQPIDLIPTVCELFGVDPGEAQHGRSLLPLCRGEPETTRPYACSGGWVDGLAEWSIRTPDWYYLLPLQTPPGDLPRGPQLYRKPEDRWEVNDVRQHHLEWADHLDDVLRRFVESTRQPGPLVYPALREMREVAGLPTPAEG